MFNLWDKVCTCRIYRSLQKTLLPFWYLIIAITYVVNHKCNQWKEKQVYFSYQQQSTLAHNSLVKALTPLASSSTNTFGTSAQCHSHCAASCWEKAVLIMTSCLTVLLLVYPEVTLISGPLLYLGSGASSLCRECENTELRRARHSSTRG